MTSSCILGSVRVEKSRTSELLRFSSYLLEIWWWWWWGGGGGGNSEMLITKRIPILKLESDLSKNLQFSSDFSQNYIEHSSTIALPWQQWMSYATGLY